MHKDIIHTELKEDGYKLLIEQLKAVIEDERDVIANLSNTSALLNEVLGDINWVGFYLMKKGGLVLGPFQGKVACIRIAVGKGVCGSAVRERKTLVVENVHEFPGHIACDGASNSEIVVPLFVEEEVVGVLDIDSPKFHRFDNIDAVYLEQVASILATECDWTDFRNN